MATIAQYTRMHHFQKKNSKIFSPEGPRENVSPGPEKRQLEKNDNGKMANKRHGKMANKRCLELNVE